MPSKKQPAEILFDPTEEDANYTPPPPDDPQQAEEAGYAVVPYVPDEAGTGLAIRGYNDSPVYAPEDLELPRLTLVQAMSKAVEEDGAKPGQWYVGGYDPKDDVILIPLKAGKARQYWDNQELRCSSPDAVTGYGDPGGDCGTCPMAVWQPGQNGKNQPPKCSFAYSYIAWSVTHEGIVMIDFKRTGLAAGKTLNTLVATRGLGRFGIKLANKKESNGKNTYYVPTVQYQKVTVEDIQNARFSIGQ